MLVQALREAAKSSEGEKPSSSPPFDNGSSAHSVFFSDLISVLKWSFPI
jgi:hypothetical protein